MKSIMTKKEYEIPALRVDPLCVEYPFLASQLDDYDDNPIFGARGRFMDDDDDF